MRAPLHHSRAVFTYSITEQATPPSPVSTTPAPSRSATPGEASQRGTGGRCSAASSGPSQTYPAYAAAAPANAPNARISRDSQEVRRPMIARNAYFGRPR